MTATITFELHYDSVKIRAAFVHQYSRGEEKLMMARWNIKGWLSFQNTEEENCITEDTVINESSVAV